jgi:cell division protein FtsW
MDIWLLFSVLALSAIGVVMVYSSTSVPRIGDTEELNTKINLFYLKKHLITLLLSMVFMMILYRIKPAKLKAVAYPLLAVSLLLLLAVFVPHLGVKINGAKRWLRLWPSTFQPSELVKFSMILFLAKYLSDTEAAAHSIKRFLVPVSVMLLFQTVLILQPDFGGAVTLGLITVGMLYIAGTPIRYLLSLLIALIPVTVVLLMQPYRLKRIIVFLDPWSDPQGSGFQLVQSLIALGRGGLMGVGLGNSQQKLNFLPEANTDFIFSLIGEELGFLGATVVIGLFFLLFLRGVKIASERSLPFSRYLAMGFTLMLTLQALINFGVVSGLLPTKGLPLPFISYGGSSLLVNFMAVGILLRLSTGEPEQAVNVLTTDMIMRKRARLKIKRMRHRGVAVS